MALKLRIDTRQFNEQLRRAADYSKRAAHVVVNSQSLALAKRSLDATKRASADDIRKLNERVVVFVRTHTKSGKPRKRPSNVYSQAPTLADMIIMKRLKAQGRTAKREEVRQMSKRMINARLKSIGFIASGWVPTLRGLIQWDRERRGLASVQSVIGRKGAKEYGQAKGYVRPAIVQESPRCRMVNQAIIQTNQWHKLVGEKGTGDPLKYAQMGVDSGIAESVSDMKQHILEKLQKLNRNTQTSHLTP